MMRRHSINVEKGGGGDAVRVLYVDDEPALLDIAREFLEMDGGMTISVSTSVNKVLEEAASGQYDVVLSDYRMPEMDGITFLKLLRERGSDIPFVIFTGRGREEVAIEALNNGADFYVQKGGDPVVQFEELRNVILQLAQRSRAERALREREEILSLITDHMQDIVTRVNSEDRIVYISPSVAASGFTPEEVVGRSIFDFVHPDDVQRLVEEADEAISRREDVTLEYRQLNKDGTYTWSEARGKYIYDENGQVQMAVFSIRNVEERKRFEEDLRISNSRCQSIVQLGNVIILGMDREGRVTWMNDFAQQFFGFTEEEIVGRPAVGTITPEVEEGTGRDLRKMVEEITHRTENIEANINQNMKKNGERAWVAWTNRLVDIGDGKKEVLCTGVDITEQYLSMSVLGDSVSMLQSILDSIPSAVLVISHDGTVQAYNPQFLDMWGLHDKYQNMPPSELMDAMLSQLDQPEELLSRWHGPMEEEERFVLALKNGVRLGVVARPHLLKGLPVGRIWSFVDQTEVLKAGEAIAEREAKFRGVFTSDAIGIGMVDDEGRIVEGNQALLRVLGHSMEELRGRHFAEFALPGEAEEEEDFFKEMKEGRRDTYSIERKVLTKGGKEIWARVTGSAVRDSTGRLRYGVGFFQDITAQKEVMERLRCSELRYRELARNLPNSMVMLFDRDLRYVLVDGGALGALGMSQSKIEGKRVDEVFQAGPFSREGGRYEEALRGETSVSTVDYRGRTYRMFSMPLVADDGQVYGGMIMGHDITDLKRTEDELRWLNRSLRVLTVGDRVESQAADEMELYDLVCQDLVRTSGHRMACIVLAEDGEWPRIVSVHGQSGNEVLCADLNEVFWEAFRTGRPAWRNEASGGPPGTGRRSGDGPRSYLSLPIIHHGRTIGVMTLFGHEAHSFPAEEVELLSEMAGEVSRSVTSFRDHADSVRSHRALSHRGRQMQVLNRSTRELSSMLDEQEAIRTLMRMTRELLDCETSMVGKMVDGRLVFREMDRRGTILPVNVSFGTGEGALGRAMAELKPYVAGAGQGGEHRNLAVVPLIGKDEALAGALWAQDKRMGGFHPWDIRLMESLADSAMAAMNNAEWVRRLRIREDELEQANRKLDLIGRITRHDLLNHLSTLTGYLELARTKGDQSTYLDKALASANNIAKHLMFARDYAEVGKSSPRWIPLREAVRKGASTVNLDDVALDMEGDEVELYVDQMVEKVFHNLLDNSIRHGGVTAIKIVAMEDPRGLRIVYTDDGKGIPASRKEEVFDLAYSHHGLYLAREILALTGIQIVERGEEGEGVRFEIIVPRGSYRRSGRAAQV